MPESVPDKVLPYQDGFLSLDDSGSTLEQTIEIEDQLNAKPTPQLETHIFTLGLGDGNSAKQTLENSMTDLLRAKSTEDLPNRSSFQELRIDPLIATMHIWNEEGDRQEAVEAYIDTGSAASFIGRSLMVRLNLLEKQLPPRYARSFDTANNGRLYTNSYVTIQLENRDLALERSFTRLRVINMDSDVMILGMTFISEHNLIGRLQFLVREHGLASGWDDSILVIRHHQSKKDVAKDAQYRKARASLAQKHEEEMRGYSSVAYRRMTANPSAPNYGYQVFMSAPRVLYGPPRHTHSEALGSSYVDMTSPISLHSGGPGQISNEVTSKLETYQPNPSVLQHMQDQTPEDTTQPGPVSYDLSPYHGVSYNPVVAPRFPMTSSRWLPSIMSINSATTMGTSRSATWATESTRNSSFTNGDAETIDNKHGAVSRRDSTSSIGCQ